MIPPRALNAPPCVMDFSKDHGAGRPTALAWIVGHPILSPPEQNIALVLSGYPGEEFSSGGAEGKGDPPLRAGPHQSRRGPGIRERNDVAQRMQRIARGHLLFTVYHHVLDPRPDKTSRWATIGTAGWFGILLLMAIPLVNLICLLVWSFGGARKFVKQSFARAMLILCLIQAILDVVGIILLGLYGPQLIDRLFLLLSGIH